MWFLGRWVAFSFVGIILHYYNTHPDKWNDHSLLLGFEKMLCFAPTRRRPPGLFLHSPAGPVSAAGSRIPPFPCFEEQAMAS